MTKWLADIYEPFDYRYLVESNLDHHPWLPGFHIAGIRMGGIEHYKRTPTSSLETITLRLQTITANIMILNLITNERAATSIAKKAIKRMRNG